MMAQPCAHLPWFTIRQRYLTVRVQATARSCRNMVRIVSWLMPN